MQISPALSYSYSHKNPQFRSVYPVQHWILGADGKFSPVVTQDLTRTLQRKLIGFLNKTIRLKNINQYSVMERVTQYLAQNDNSYSVQPLVRSYYSHKPDEIKQKNNAVSYLITGADVEVFDDQYGKNIGRFKADAPFSAELKSALEDYNLRGMNYVVSRSKNFKKDGVKSALNTKFQEIRNKKGKVVEYRLMDIKFCPAEGDGNPLVRYYNFINNGGSK